MTAAPPPPASQYAQLTYTSFDDGAGRGGWQVKEVRGDLTTAQRDTLVGRVVTRFDLDPRLPDFPTEAQIAERPSRLAYARMDDAGVFWHTTAAGPDATGRPGNVFAHIAVDRSRVHRPGYRPIRLWGSPDWLRPYRAENVAAARLGTADIPAPGSIITLSSVVRFVTDDAVDRQGVFRVLIDAVTHALEDGPAVVLLTHSHDASAAWIAAVSYLLPPELAGRLGWTTHDRPDQIPAHIDRGTHLIAVPADSVDERTTFGGALVIDENEAPLLGDVGSVHRVARGEVPVSALSTFVEGVLEDEDTAVAVLLRRDEVGLALGGQSTSGAWPLAVAIAENPALDEFHDDALRVVAHDEPADTAALPEVAALIARARKQFPITPDEALAQLRKAVAGQSDPGIPASRFLVAALDDRQWLHTSSFGKLPAVQAVDLSGVRATITSLLADAEKSVDHEPTGTAIFVIRLTILLDQLARHDSEFVEVEAELTRLWERIDPSVIWDTNQQSNLVFIPLGVRAKFVRPSLLRWNRVHLEAFRSPLWNWVFDDGSGRPLEPPANPSNADRRLYPIAVAACLRGTPAGTPDALNLGTEQRQAAVTQAIEFVLEDLTLDDAQARDLTGELTRLEAPAAADLLMWTHEKPRRTSPTMLHDHVFYENPTPDMLYDLAGQPRGVDAAQDALVAAACLRRFHMNPGNIPDPPTLIETVRVCMGDPVGWNRPLAEDLRRMLYAGMLVAQSRAAAFATAGGPADERLTHQRPDTANRLLDLLGILIGRKLLDIGWVAARSYLSQFEHIRIDHVIADDLATEEPWADRLLDEAVQDQRYHGPATADALRDAVWPTLRTVTAADAQDFFAEHPKQASAWLESFKIISPESPLRWLRSREDR
ncbi:hypothetical protein [Gordonia sp. NB41Y]|uniref:GAP1-N2 domain-containing protein n=1 Tax=Gordonia sp. NB41Y TaxID=875808 RepID=UPI00273BD8AF|nr:hypothetical protein [Gordonia sp. NB41Y]WLP88618.1 hypothetical protein Q9K23_13380 [Gordonia sp. NB41Y]